MLGLAALARGDDAVALEAHAREAVPLRRRWPYWSWPIQFLVTVDSCSSRSYSTQSPRSSRRCAAAVAVNKNHDAVHTTVRQYYYYSYSYSYSYY